MPIYLKCQSILSVSKSSSNDDDLLTVLVFALCILQLSIEGLSAVKREIISQIAFNHKVYG